jgi:protein phosphatase
MAEPIRFKVASLTNTGLVREHNEDNFFTGVESNDTSQSDIALQPGGALFAVADGMGGEQAGEIASAIAIQTVKAGCKKWLLSPTGEQELLQRLKDLLLDAHQAILYEAKNGKGREGMGTTLTLFYLIGTNAYIVWCGDSRVYRLYRDNRGAPHISLVTHDHSLVWEFVQKGQITPEDARLHEFSNVVTQSLGDRSNPPKPDHAVLPLNLGERWLLCSDGLNSMIPDGNIEALLGGEKPLPAVCHSLIDAANEAGGHDNTTVIVLEITAAPFNDQSSAFNSAKSTKQQGGEPEPVIVQKVKKAAKPSNWWIFIPIFFGGIATYFFWLSLAVRPNAALPDTSQVIDSVELSPAPPPPTQLTPLENKGRRPENKQEGSKITSKEKDVGFEEEIEKFEELIARKNKLYFEKIPSLQYKQAISGPQISLKIIPEKDDDPNFIHKNREIAEAFGFNLDLLDLINRIYDYQNKRIKDGFEDVAYIREQLKVIEKELSKNEGLFFEKQKELADGIIPVMK